MADELGMTKLQREALRRNLTLICSDLDLGVVIRLMDMLSRDDVDKIRVEIT